MRKAALKQIASLVESDPRVVFLGSDLGAGVLADAMSNFPDRVLMEGIAEQHLVGMAGGLALEGFVPYVHTIGTFLTRRALEQVIVDVALHALPVRLIATGGGMVYAPLGPTHQAIDDFALMRAIPGMAVFAPIDPREMEELISALVTWPGPAYVRVGKGGESIVTDHGFSIGSTRVLHEGSDAVVFTTGAVGHEVLQAAQYLADRKMGVKVVHVATVAPLDSAAIKEILINEQTVFVVEEHLPEGGLWTTIVETAMRLDVHPRILQVSLPREYAQNYGTQAEHWKACGLDASSLARFISDEIHGDAHG